MVHPVLKFSNDELELYLSGIPYFVVIEKGGMLRLKVNYKIFRYRMKEHTVVLSIMNKNKIIVSLPFSVDNNLLYDEGIIEIPIGNTFIQAGEYDVSFNVKINDSYIYGKTSPYCMKIIVSYEDDLNELLKNPQLIESPISEVSKETLKSRLKSLPVIGWFLRWSYNLVRLNNLKYRTFMLEQQNTALKKHIDSLANQVSALRNDMKNMVSSQVAKQISYQSVSFQQRIDQFVFDTKIKIDTLNSPGQALDILENNAKLFLDDYYLAFENKFRGSREQITQRYEKYLPYCSLPRAKALDIGCGRGEWVELLQSKGIDAYGVDLNHAMVEDGILHDVKNLEVKDAFEFLASCPDNSFDLITAFHIIEHIPFEKLLVLFKELKRVASSNAVILLETPNPENLLVAAYTFYKDPTHLNPLPSEVTTFMLEYFNFTNIQVYPLHPFPDSMRIKEKSQTAFVLNHYLYSEQDYLIVAENEKN